MHVTFVLQGMSELRRELLDLQQQDRAMTETEVRRLQDSQKTIDQLEKQVRHQTRRDCQQNFGRNRSRGRMVDYILEHSCVCSLKYNTTVLTLKAFSYSW